MPCSLRRPDRLGPGPRRGVVRMVLGVVRRDRSRLHDLAARGADRMTLVRFVCDRCQAVLGESLPAAKMYCPKCKRWVNTPAH